MITCISFDFDATLAYKHPRSHFLIPQLCKEKNIHLTTEDYCKKSCEMQRNLPAEWLERLKRFGILDSEERKQLIFDYNRMLLDYLGIPDSSSNGEYIKEWIINQWSQKQRKILYDDVSETIKELKKRGLKLYILSGNHSQGITTLLDEANILSFFEEIITVDKYNIMKVKNFKILLNHSQESPENILHIGDSLETDAKGAQNFSIEPIIIRREDELVYDYNRVPHSFKTINRLEELFAILDENQH
jgi:HAD superfamily hydrolase (TIGR01549 family)